MDLSRAEDRVLSVVDLMDQVARRLARALLHRMDRGWDAAARRAPGRNLRHALLAGTVVTVLCVHVARDAVDDGVRKVHPNGASGFGVNSLHQGAARARRTISTWQQGDDVLRGSLPHDVFHIAAVQTVLELVLVVPVTVLLFAVLRVARRRTWSYVPSMRAPLGVAALGSALYGVLGVFNQVVELYLIAAAPRRQPVGTSWPAEIQVPVWVLNGTGTVRKLMFVLTVVPLVLAAFGYWRRRSAPALQLFRRRHRRLAAGQDTQGAPTPRFGWRTAPTGYRILVVVVVVHAALFLVSIPAVQAADALRLWSQRPSLLVWATLATVLLSVTLAVLALRISTDAHHRRAVLGRRGTVRLLSGSVVVVIVAAVLRWTLPQGERASASLLALGLLGTSIALLSLPLTPPEPAADVPAPGRGPGALPTDTTAASGPVSGSDVWVPAVLAFTPPAVLAMAASRAVVPSFLGSDPVGWLLLGIVANVVLSVVLFTAVRSASARVRPQWSRTLYRSSIAVPVVVASIVGWAVLTDPWQWAPKVGVTALLCLFLVLVVGGFGTLGYTTEKRSLPAALDLLGFRRAPVLSGLIVLGAVGHTLVPNDYHDVRTDDAATADVAQITAREAFARWTEHVIGVPTHEPAPPVQPATPMVVLMAAGGGIKAAAFTAAAIDCILNPLAFDRPAGRPALGGNVPGDLCASSSAWPQLFIASGASGGSVGIASVLAERAHQGSGGEDWVSTRLGRDLLSPELSWQLFAEVGNSVLNVNPGKDRGEVLETSWRRAFREGGEDPGGAPFYTDLLNPERGEPPGPFVFFSATDVTDGCRVNISPIRSAQPHSDGQDVLRHDDTRHGPCQNQRFSRVDGPVDQSDTRDLFDYLCGDNVDLATAAFLSARFPYVSPAATRSCPDGNPLTDDMIAIGDGGYRDNSGAGSILDNWAVLQPLVDDYNATHTRCIAPILVEINNGYDGHGAPNTEVSANQLTVPAVGAANVYGVLSYGPVERIAAEFNRPIAADVQLVLGTETVQNRFFRISLTDHPGVTAPLGWSLSRSAVDDLVDQLGRSANREALLGLRALLQAEEGSLTCRRA